MIKATLVVVVIGPVDLWLEELITTLTGGALPVKTVDTDEVEVMVIQVVSGGRVVVTQVVS